MSSTQNPNFISKPYRLSHSTPITSINRRMITPTKKNGERTTIIIYYHQKGQWWRGKEEEQRRPEREGLKEGNGHEPLQSEAWFRCGEAHAEYHGDERD